MQATATISKFVADGLGADHMNGWGWGMAMFGWLFMVLTVVLVGWVLWLIGGQLPTSRSRERRAADVLDERYARGEIDRDEYRSRKADLEE